MVLLTIFLDDLHLYKQHQNGETGNFWWSPTSWMCPESWTTNLNQLDTNCPCTCWRTQWIVVKQDHIIYKSRFPNLTLTSPLLHYENDKQDRWQGETLVLANTSWRRVWLPAENTTLTLFKKCTNFSNNTILVSCFLSKFLPLKLLTALLWHQAAFFPQAQDWKKKLLATLSQGEKERERDFANSTNWPTSNFAARISFSFMASGWVHGQNVHPIQEKGGNVLVQSSDSGSRCQGYHNQSHRKVFPKSFVWGCVN